RNVDQHVLCLGFLRAPGVGTGAVNDKQVQVVQWIVGVEFACNPDVAPAVALVKWINHFVAVSFSPNQRVLVARNDDCVLYAVAVQIAGQNRAPWQVAAFLDHRTANLAPGGSRNHFKIGAKLLLHRGAKIERSLGHAGASARWMSEHIAGHHRDRKKAKEITHPHTLTLTCFRPSATALFRSPQHNGIVIPTTRGICSCPQPFVTYSARMACAGSSTKLLPFRSL